MKIILMMMMMMLMMMMMNGYDDEDDLAQTFSRGISGGRAFETAL